MRFTRACRRKNPLPNRAKTRVAYSEVWTTSPLLYVVGDGVSRPAEPTMPAARIEPGYVRDVRQIQRGRNVSLTRIRSEVLSHRGSLSAIAAVILVGLVLFVTHSVPAAHDMEGDEAGMSDAVTICLAIVQAAGTLVVARLALKYRSVPRAPQTAGGIAETRFIKCFANPGHRCREGPAVLQVFRH